MSGIFERLSEEICSVCLAGNEDCAPCEKACYFRGDYEELYELCERAEELASGLKSMCARYSDYDAELAAQNI